VIQDFGLFVQHQLQGIPVAAEIRDEHFDAGARRLPANFADGVRPNRRPTIG